MNFNDVARWLAPIVTGVLCVVIPSIIRAAISGQFAEMRNEGVARMAEHNENENAHPNLAAVQAVEKRLAGALEDVKDEVLREISGLREQLNEVLRKQRGPAPAKKRGR